MANHPSHHDLGDYRFELQPVDCMEFEMTAEQINKINFDSPKVKEDFDTLKISKWASDPAPKKLKSRNTHPRDTRRTRRKAGVSSPAFLRVLRVSRG